jgi:hypothetical protein
MRGAVRGARRDGVWRRVECHGRHGAPGARRSAWGKVPLERGDELAQVSNMEPFRTMAQGLLGSVRSQLGDTPGGMASWTLALERAYSMHDRGGEALTLWQRARTRRYATPPDYAARLRISTPRRSSWKRWRRDRRSRGCCDFGRTSFGALGRATEADAAGQAIEGDRRGAGAQGLRLAVADDCARRLPVAVRLRRPRA